MACSTCQSGSPNGCQNTGHCATGGCNKLNTYDWLAVYDFEDPTGTDILEISFKKGARKEFFRNHPQHPVYTQDIVVVDTGSGYDVGVVSLTGELVRLQMKRKKVKEASVTNQVLRVANDRDIERLNEYRGLEQNIMVRARAIAGSVGLDMKVCDVEYRGDGRKATFYYTAEGRVDFRELVRHYAKEFQVKVEMRQIGARQESSRIGGIGSCGRELCCSTWLTDFKTVNTHAARYQNLSINQAKLSGQCGRLKCCLNYELDTYMEAMEEFPQDVDALRFQGGTASLIKIDIFKKVLYYSVEVDKGRNTFASLSLDRVNFIKQLNMKGQLPDQLQDPDAVMEEEKMDFADVTGDIELPDLRKKRKKKKKPHGDNPQRQDNRRTENATGDGTSPERRREDRRPHDKPRHEQRRSDKPSGDGSQQGRRRDDRRPHDPSRPPSPQGKQKGDPSDSSGSQEVKPPQSNPPADGQRQNMQGSGQQKRKNKNRFRNKNKGPRPDGGTPPPSNPPSA